MVAIFYPFSLFCEIAISLLSLQNGQEQSSTYFRGATIWQVRLSQRLSQLFRGALPERSPLTERRLSSSPPPGPLSGLVDGSAGASREREREIKRGSHRDF